MLTGQGPLQGNQGLPMFIVGLRPCVSLGRLGIINLNTLRLNYDEASINA